MCLSFKVEKVENAKMKNGHYLGQNAALKMSAPMVSFVRLHLRLKKEISYQDIVAQVYTLLVIDNINMFLNMQSSLNLQVTLQALFNCQKPTS